MALDDPNRHLAQDSVIQIASGSPDAAYNLALAFMANVDSKDIDLNLAVIEALALLAKQGGCAPAQTFLDQQWSDMKEVLRKRWSRAGFE